MPEEVATLLMVLTSACRRPGESYRYAPTTPALHSLEKQRETYETSMAG